MFLSKDCHRVIMTKWQLYVCFKPFSLNNTEIQKTYGSHWVCSENACTEEKIVYDIEDNYSIICADELYPYE